jgi:iron complex transport system substrate-binding protein
MHALRNGAGMAGVLLLAAGVALAPLPAAAEATVVDAAGRSVRVGDASRILSIGGDVTEIIYALGAGNRVVGVDTTSQFPPEALQEKKSVGYMRALSSEGVISVGATLVLASERAGPPEVVKTLKTTSMPYVEVADQNSADGIVGKIRLIAKAVGTDPMGEKLVEKVIADFKALDEARAKVSRPLRALFVLGVQNGRVMVGGQNTSADAILKLAGATNVATAVNGFRPVPDEAMVELAPDVIVAMRRSSDSDAHDLSQLFALKGVQSTPAGAAKRIVVMDGLYLLGFGPRAPAAAHELMGYFYPELAGKAGGKPGDVTR